MTDHAPRLTVVEKVGYGFGDLASNLFWQMFSIFIAKFYTDVFLLSAAAMGTMMLVSRVGDAVIDPLIGTIADRTNTRWGHFRPYLLWMALPMALTAVATFTTPDRCTASIRSTGLFHWSCSRWQHQRWRRSASPTPGWCRFLVPG